MTRTVPTWWRRVVPAALLAAAVALGGSAIGDPAVADAAPEWDIGAYDQCITKADLLYLEGAIDAATRDGMYRGCCTGSGGVVKNDVECKAANAPGRTVPPGVITQTLTPAPVAPPLGDITQAFTPAP
jgi:hypothetical protein